MIATLDRLSPSAREAALAWLDAVTSPIEDDLRAPLRDEFLTVLCDGLDEHATAEDVAALIAEIGPVTAEQADAHDPRVGRWFGMPYDWRPPTAERVREALWSPADPRVLRPKAFGAGWDVNFGAVAVRLGLIEPDAEDEPFAHTSHEAFTSAAAFPVVMAGAVVAHYAVRGRSLPNRLPQHWDAAGRPDRWVSKRRAGVLDVGLALSGAALGVGAAASRTQGTSRAARMAVAAGMGAVAAKVTVFRTIPGGGWWVGPGMVAGVLGAPALTLLGLALAGRSGEQRRDLGR